MTQSIYFAPYQVPLVEPATGLMSRPWYLFFQALFARAGGSTGMSSDDLAEFATEDFDSAAIDAAPLAAQIQALQSVAFDADLTEAPSRQDLADALILAHAAIDDAVVAALQTVSVANSITGAGTQAAPLQLSGDAPTPGNSYSYGTNAGGLKGWYVNAVVPTSAPASASVGLAAVAGSGTAYLLANAAPALNVGIAPTWTGLHAFFAGLTASNAAVTGTGSLVQVASTKYSWAASQYALEIGAGGAMTGDGSGTVGLANNLYYNSVGPAWTYKNAGFAAICNVTNGAYNWYTCVSGAAGATAALNPKMTLSNAGALNVAGSIAMNGLAPPAQVTGWGTPTGPLIVANFSGAAATLVQCSNAIAKIITDLKALGLYGP